MEDRGINRDEKVAQKERKRGKRENGKDYKHHNSKRKTEEQGGMSQM